MAPKPGESSVSVKVKVDSLVILDKIAKKGDMSRHKLMVNLLQVSVEEIEVFKRVGLFKIGLLARDVIQGFQSITGLGKRKDNDEKMVPIHISKEWLARIDSIADQADLSRHQLMKNLIEVGADELNSLYNRALMPIALAIIDVRKAINKICENGEKAISAVEHEMRSN